MMQSSIPAPPKPIWSIIQSVNISLNFKNKYLFKSYNNYRDTDFAKQLTDAFKALEKRHPKRIASVNATTSRLIEEPLLPMLVVQERNSGEIVAQVLNFADYFPNKQGVTPENAEKLLRIKGVLEPLNGKQFDSKKEEIEHQLALGSSYLHDQLNNEEVDALNHYIEEKERRVELKLDPATINYKDCLFEAYKGVEDPFDTEIADFIYSENPNDPTQVTRKIVFKNGQFSDGLSQN